MKRFMFLFSLAIFLPSVNMQAQILPEHRWENRLLLVFSEDDQDSQYLEQMEILQSDEAGLEERRLLIYIIQPSRYKLASGSGEWTDSDKMYRKFKKFESDFEISLIGLDGYTKLLKDKVLSLQELFSVIDAMPMRQREIMEKSSGDL